MENLVHIVGRELSLNADALADLTAHQIESLSPCELKIACLLLAKKARGLQSTTLSLSPNDVNVTSEELCMELWRIEMAEDQPIDPSL